MDQLRDELQGLLQEGWIQTSGPLERRGTEVDHHLYPDDEGQRSNAPHSSPATQPASPGPAAIAQRTDVPLSISAPTVEFADRFAALEALVESLRHEGREVRGELQAVREELAQLGNRLGDLRHDLGG